MKNKFIISIVAFLLIGSLSLNVFATLGDGLNTGILNNVLKENPTNIDGFLSRIGSTILIILQVAAVAGVVFTGVKYMYAASNDKAKIKETLIWLIIGTVFVFAAPRVIEFVSSIGNNIL